MSRKDQRKPTNESFIPSQISPINKDNTKGFNPPKIKPPKQDNASNSRERK